MNSINYQQQFCELQEANNLDWFKPGAGRYKIEFLSEGEPYTIEHEGEKIDKVRFTIKANGQEKVWGISKGKTHSSIYGQLLTIATKAEPVNQMKGKRVTLMVTSDGNKKTYTLAEVFDLMPQTPETEEVQL